MTKEKTYKEKDTDNTKGKKKFQQRLIQDKEATEEIESFLTNQETETKDEPKCILRPFT